MKVIVKKYYRYNEDCNWQLDTEQVKEFTEEQFNEFKEYAGFDYNERYNEYYSEGYNKLTIVKPQA